MKKIIAIGIGVACTLGSCNIERLPYGSMDSGTIAGNPEKSLDNLMLGCYAQMKDWADVMHRCGEYAGDNITIRGTTSDAFYEFISYSRSPNNGRLNTFWNNSYKTISQTSNIIKMIQEGKSEAIDQHLGECYFLRGTMYFYLCRAYGRPYYQNPEKNLGVPIVNGTPDNILDYSLPDRSTVKETYAQAISDLEKSIQLMNKPKGAIYASDNAAYALLSRIYLFMSGTYENPNKEYAQLAVDYADKVIASGDYTLLSRDEFMNYNSLVPESNKETIFAVKRKASEYTGFDFTYNLGGMYSNVDGMGWGEMYPSSKYMDLLDETGRNDWREGKFKIVDARANFVRPVYSKGNIPVFRFIRDLFNASGKQTGYLYMQAEYEDKGGNLIWNEKWTDDNKQEHTTTYTLNVKNKEQDIYTINYRDGKTYTGYLDYHVKLNKNAPMFYIYKCSKESGVSQLHSPIIARLGEIYLNRAEALAKLGRYGEAKDDLNLVRERSIPGAGYPSLEAQNASARIDKERQLELAYQAERSYDVYRNGGDLTRQYPGPHDAMELVKATDYRVVYYIPQSAINAYPAGSTLTQNPTSN